MRRGPISVKSASIFSKRNWNRFSVSVKSASQIGGDEGIIF
jgi:hypothetical protein